MEQQKLPNVTIAMVLSILGFLCCCVAGLPGIILGGIALFLVSKDEKLYKENPEDYSNYSTLKTVKIISIIVLILGLIYFIMNAWTIYQTGWDAQIEQSRELLEQLGIE
ncbi:hypothetical protein BFP77_05240 [Maribacter sp. 4U21]|uniref:CCC motif membrane protein n=1 Tax=Maribacter sp. 4U21 TaxID=1889779 RepID=UPI000C153E59|nr:CCC motif membrane protein [Maribacter sp. 4U21]PIB30025.1 hypothetical protein BFP77_05240 [Maribacter sp. 4U21]